MSRSSPLGVLLNFLFGETLAKILNFLSIPIFAALVSKRDFSDFYIDYFQAIIAVGVCNLCIWEASLRYSRRNERLISSLFFFKILGSYNLVVSCFLSYIASPEFGALYMACWMLIFWQYELRSRGKTFGFALLNSLNALVLFVSGLIMLNIPLISNGNLLYIIYIVGGLASGYLFFTERLSGDDAVKTVELQIGIRLYATYSAPLVLNYFSWWFFLGGYLVVFDFISPNFSGRDDLVVASRLFGIFSLIATVTSMCLQHFRFQGTSASEDSAISNSVLFLLLIPVFLIATWALEVLAGFVFPATFAQSFTLLYPLALLGWVLALNQVLGTDLLVLDKSMALMSSNLGGIFVAISIGGAVLFMDFATPLRLILSLSIGAAVTFAIRLRMLGSL